jgi:hypothetical protein
MTMVKLDSRIPLPASKNGPRRGVPVDQGPTCALAKPSLRIRQQNQILVDSNSAGRGSLSSESAVYLCHVNLELSFVFKLKDV